MIDIVKDIATFNAKREPERLAMKYKLMRTSPWRFSGAARRSRRPCFRHRPYVLRSLQPSEDRVALDAWNGKLPRLESVVNNMAQLSAWAQLRSDGRRDQFAGSPVPAE